MDLTVIDFIEFRAYSPATFKELVAWRSNCLGVHWDVEEEDVAFCLSSPDAESVRQFLKTKEIYIKHIGGPSIGYDYTINNNNPRINFSFSTIDDAIVAAIHEVFKQLGRDPNAFR